MVDKQTQAKEEKDKTNTPESVKISMSVDESETKPSADTAPKTAAEDAPDKKISAEETKTSANKTLKTTETTAPKAKREGVAIPEKPTWDPQPGQVVRVSIRITETTKKGQEKERLQVFEGIVIARKHGTEPGATFTVRKESKGGFGVERIFPLHSPIIAKIEVVKQYRANRAKLSFLRKKLKKGKKLREITTS